MFFFLLISVFPHVFCQMSSSQHQHLVINYKCWSFIINWGIPFAHYSFFHNVFVTLIDFVIKIFSKMFWLFITFSWFQFTTKKHNFFLNTEKCILSGEIFKYTEKENKVIRNVENGGINMYLKITWLFM